MSVIKDVDGEREGRGAVEFIKLGSGSGGCGSGEIHEIRQQHSFRSGCIITDERRGVGPRVRGSTLWILGCRCSVLHMVWYGWRVLSIMPDVSRGMLV